MKLSIVIPTFDTAAMTKRCCEAVLASLPADAEVIVVDDGSRDDTASMMPPRVRVIRLEENRGYAIAANRGVNESAGDIVLLLNSDAIVEAGALDALLRAFDQDPSLGVAGARLLNAGGTPQWSGGRTPTLPWMIGVVSGAGALARVFGAVSDKPAEVDWVSGAAMAFRREVWDKAGGLSERYRFYCQDIDFCLDARALGWDVRIIEAARVVHAHGATIAPSHPLHYDPEKLWPDLVTWGSAHYSRFWWAPRARRILAGVAWLRAIAWKLRGRDAGPLIRAARAIRRS